MRIAHTTLVDNLAQAVKDQKSLLAQSQIQIASGQRNLRRSDDTAAAREISTLENDQTQETQYQKNIDHAVFWSQVTDGKLDNLNSLAQRIQELSVAARNGTQPDSYRKDLAEEANNILEDIYNLANTTVDGVPIFGGTDTANAPFTATRDAAGDITAVTFNANNLLRKVQIGATATAEYGVAGGGADGVFESTDKATNLFTTIANLRDVLRTGEVPDDPTAQAVEVATDNVIDKVVDNGLKQKRFQGLAEKFLDVEMERRNRISQLKDVDIAQAAIELSQMQASYQASLQVAARIGSMNIMNFL
ncbi:flagellar hook-associated protein 3 [bacterium F16]|nr:flagellar hook-associated protein 3 [bacterium F16]